MGKRKTRREAEAAADMRRSADVERSREIDSLRGEIKTLDDQIFVETARLLKAADRGRRRRTLEEVQEEMRRAGLDPRAGRKYLPN